MDPTPATPQSSNPRSLRPETPVLAKKFNLPMLSLIERADPALCPRNA